VISHARCARTARLEERLILCPPRRGLAAGVLLAVSIVIGACGARTPHRAPSVEPVYDARSGRLVQLRYDADLDGRTDAVSYMDGGRVLRTEIDTDRDGLVDRWEYYDAAQRLERVGFSRAHDGKEDAWSFAGPDKLVTRIEVSTARDGRVDRIEHYDRSGLVAAEEDSDRDGLMDKWETYAGGRLAAVAFDTSHRGKPDRRLVYDTGGAARVGAHESSVVRLRIAYRRSRPRTTTRACPGSLIANPRS
jgi:hypothetical protein